MKVHFLYSLRNVTDCGIRAHLCPGFDDEADTVDSRRIEVTRDQAKVTCGSCRRVRGMPQLSTKKPEKDAT